MFNKCACKLLIVYNNIKNQKLNIFYTIKLKTKEQYNQDKLLLDKIKALNPSIYK